MAPRRERSTIPGVAPVPSGPPPVVVRVLGALIAEVDGAPVSLGGPRPRAVLARLAVADGRMVTDDALIEDVWGDGAPRTALLTLQGYISSLRKSLDPANARGGLGARVLVRDGPGYALRLPPGGLDAAVFATLAAEARTALGRGEAETAARLLDDALALWRGPAYGDCLDREFAAPEIARLTALRHGATEDRAAAALVLGDHTRAVAMAEAHTREHPLRERGWVLLAAALYRSGRQGDASTALRTARRTLADELGADPGPDLVALQDAVLRQDDAGVAAVLPTPVTTSPARRHRRVPVPLTPTVGREDDVRTVADALRDHRSVTLTGPGGMGKTRLALEVAGRRDDPDGPWFVELAGLPGRSADEAGPDAGADPAGAVATALGVTSGRGVDALVAVLADRRALLVLDNCEHVVDSVAVLVSEILRSCPGMTVLATSRVSLGTPGEFVHETPPLATTGDGPAVELFLARASDATGGAPATEDDRLAAARLCEGLDGMPLAIELAAAQARTLSVQQLLDHLDDRLAVLRGGSRATPRHATMAAAVEWSYRSLTDGEKLLFTELGIFEGGFDLEAITAVVDRRDAVLDLAPLVEKSLVKALGGHPRRYRMLETLRSYAAFVRDHDVTARVRRRHVQWVTDLADAAYVELRGPRAAQWMDRLDREMPNVRAALEYCADDLETHLHIAGGLYWFWYRRGHVAEGLRYLEPAMKARDLPAAVTVRAVAGLTITRYLAGDIAGLMESFGRLAELEPTTVGDPVPRSDALVALAYFEAGAGLVEPALTHAADAVVLARELGAPYSEAEALMSTGTAWLRSGEAERAHDYLGRAIDVATTSGYRWCEASALWLDAKVSLAEHDDDRAVASLVRMIDACEEAADTTSTMVGLMTLAYALFRRGHVEDAAALRAVVDLRSESIGYWPAAMDPVDLGPYVAELTESIPADTAAAAVATARAAAEGRDGTSDLVEDILQRCR